jgi:hypothetical protein
LHLGRFGSFALIAAGGFLAYQYRFQIQRFFESVGIRTPWMNKNISDAVQSGVAKIGGKVDRELNRPSIDHSGKTSQAV